MRIERWLTVASLLALAMGASNAFGATLTRQTSSGSTAVGGAVLHSLEIPAWDGGMIFFVATKFTQEDGFSSGLYAKADGILPYPAVVVGEVIPDGRSEEFEAFCVTPSVWGDVVAFCAQDTTEPFPLEGIYFDEGGASVGIIANPTDLVPGGTGTFSSFGRPSIDTSQTAFGASDSIGDRGVYVRRQGGFGLVANRRTIVPGTTGTFANANFSEPSADGGLIAFGGEENAHPAFARRGIYLFDFDQQSLSVIVDSTMTIPGETSLFFSFASPSLSNGAVAFFGAGGLGEIGVYSNAGGTLDVVADRQTAIPEGDGDFTGFSGMVSHEAGNVAFRGYGSDGQEGIYLLYEGELQKLADADDPLDSEPTTALEIRQNALSGDGVVFRATFADGSHAIYLAQVPEPQLVALQLAGLATVALLFRSGRSRRVGHSSPHRAR